MQKADQQLITSENVKTILIKQGYFPQDGSFPSQATNMIFIQDKRRNKKLTSRVQALKQLNHPHVIKYVHHFIEGEILFIIAERGLMSLEDYLKQIPTSNFISQDSFFDLVGQLLDGIHYLHQRGVAHKNLNASNVYSFSHNQFKLRYFRVGITHHHLNQDKDSHSFSKSQSSNDNLMHLSPSILQQQEKIDSSQVKLCKIQQSMKEDIWALGIMLLKILGVKPYFCISLSCGLESFKNISSMSPEVNELLKFILKRDEKERPTIDENKRVILRDKDHQYDKAEALFYSAIDANPNNSGAYSNLDILFFRRDKQSQSEKINESLLKALEFDAQNEDALILKALLVQKTDQRLKQRKYSSQALEINCQNNPFVLSCIGRGGDEAFQIKYHIKALQKDHDFGFSYFLIGSIYQKQKKYENALLIYCQGIGTQFPESMFLSKIGQIFIELGLKEKGIKYLKKSITLFPQNRYDMSYLSSQYFSEQQYDKALPLLKELIKRFPQFYQYRANLSEILFLQKQYIQAEEQIRKCVEAVTHNSKIFILYGKISGKINKQSEAKQTFEKAIELDPLNCNIYIEYSKSLEQFGDVVKARELLEKAYNISKNLSLLLKISQLRRQEAQNQYEFMYYGNG